MDVPPAFENLAKTRGTGVEGAIPSDTVILFAIGKLWHTVIYHSKIPLKEYVSDFLKIFWSSFIGKSDGQSEMANLSVLLR